MSHQEHPAKSSHQHGPSQCQADVCCTHSAAAAVAASVPQVMQHSGFHQSCTTPTTPPPYARGKMPSHKKRFQSPVTPPEHVQAKHAKHDSCIQSPKFPALDDCQSQSSSASSSLSTEQQARESSQKLLWWQLVHVTIRGSRLAVGDSCYIITGDCVVCKVDDEEAMVECSCCKRFTHFQCACPQLNSAPEVQALILQLLTFLA